MADQLPEVLSPEQELHEAVIRGAIDSLFYCSFFFPKTVRQDFPLYAPTLWNALEDPAYRYVDFKIFRDGAKTTTCRLFTSKRIAYAISHNVVYTSNSERHAARSIDWLKRQVEYNAVWSRAFGLRKGSKWTDTEIEIIHGVDEFPIRIIAVGITGQVRGINFDDYRPDLVVADDVDNEETAGTEEQRKKASELFFGALIRGLAQPTDSPEAKAVVLGTPLADGDIIDTCSKDPTWKSLTFSCFDDHGQSIWPAKFPTEHLQREKQAYIARNQLGLWMREMECQIMSQEEASFRLEWLKEFSLLPEQCWFFVAIDPARSDSPTADYFAMILFGVYKQSVFVEDMVHERGVDPDMALAHLFAWRSTRFIRYVVVESVAYQQMLAWFLRRQFERHRIYIPVREFDDRRRKADRILQNILDFAPQGNLYCRRSPRTQPLVEQFFRWNPLAKMHDDAIDCLGIGLASLKGQIEGSIEGEFERVLEEEKDLSPLKVDQLCP